ncbi:MAG: T9SS type A sorting domain-containing protein [Bacteroidetes bacterium]|nr:T9SS type A sorting domain-containing protein [Bacteroidota bacterium]
MIDFTVDKIGSIYITGNFNGTMDFDPGFGTAIISATAGAPNTDSYILKLNEDLSFSWVETVGGLDGDGGENITIGNNFSVHSSGYYESTVDFDFSAGTSNLTVNQVNDIDYYVSTISQCIIPSISTQASTSAVCEGGNVTFSIPVIGTNFTPTWQVNSGTGFVNISGVEYYESQFGPNINLEIYPTPINYNNYQYRLIVSTPCGADTSSIITLNVQSAPIIISQPSNQNVCRNSSSAFSVVDVIIPGSFYQWYANGIPINDGGIYSGASLPDLQISSVDDSLAGVQYFCSIMGSCGVTNSDTVSLTVSPNYNQSISSTICNGTNYIFGTQTLTNAGNYTETFQSIYGCDSIVNLNLIVTTIDTSTTVSGFLLSANQVSANYQWLTCNNTIQPAVYTIITGETNQSFTAPSNANYAIALSKNGCVDTSDCINVNVIGINDEQNVASSIIVFPNPNNGGFNINSPDNSELKITDVLGKVVYENKIQAGSNRINISQLSGGIYYLVIKHGGESIIKKIVKE